MTNIPYIASPSSVTVFLNNLPLSFSNDSIEYEQTLRILHDQDLTDEERIARLNALGNQRVEAHEKRWDKLLAISDRLRVNDNGELLWDDVPMHGTVAQRLLKLYNEQLDIAPMVAFITNLKENPSYRVVENLYDFLEVGKIPITSDGHFLAYKAIRDDWYSIASDHRTGQRLRNQIGDVVQVPRNEVDENPERTCSYGLHVCSYDYLPHFAHANGHVVVCKINPRDVVAIPTDYNNTKMRVCRYEVVGEVTGYYKDNTNILSASPFNATYDDAQIESKRSLENIDWVFDDLAPTGLPNLSELDEPGRYEVLGYSPQHEVNDLLATAGTIAEAMQLMQGYIGDDTYTAVRILDTQFDRVIMVVNNNVIRP